MTARPTNDNTVKDEARERDKVMRLTLWRKMLSEQRDIAHVQVVAVVQTMRENGVHHADITRYRWQMLNGVATPDDFVTGQYGTSMRA